MVTSAATAVDAALAEVVRALPRPDPRSTPPTPATPTRARGSGWPPSTSRRSWPRSAWSPIIRESARGRTSVVRPVRGRRAGGRSAGPGRPAGARPPRRRAGRPGRVVACTRSPARSRDGYVWGRGAVDMKDFDAMMLAVVRAMAARGPHPAARPGARASSPTRRPAGAYGAHWLVDNHRTCSRAAPRRSARWAASPSPSPPDLRLYLVETAEKGLAWLRLHAQGRPGHGSMIHDDNAVTALAEAVARVGRHRFPVVMTDTVRAFLIEVSDALGVELDPDAPGGGDRQARHDRADRSASTIRNTANPTRLAAGYKENVIPSRASATIDCRTAARPARDRSWTQLREVIGPDIDIEYRPAPARRWRPPSTGRWSTAMAAALRAEDPGARAVPYMLSGGTDAKAFSRLGIRCFGFAPLRLPPDLNFSALFHGIDERVPVEGLQFGVRVLDRFFATC